MDIAMSVAAAARTRDYSGPVTNTDIWDSFALRSDDVIVCTPPKCGTTWMLNIVMMLIHGRVVPDAGNRDAAPWLDCAFRDRQAIANSLDSMTRRRCIKSHSPMDGIAYGPTPTYIVVYRHPVDVHFSMRSHAENMKENLFGHMFPEDIPEGFRRFVTAPLTDGGTDDLTVASIVHHYRRALDRRGNGNVHFFHYADLSRDLPGQIARLASAMGIRAPETLVADLAKANTFASMRKVVEASEDRFSEASPFRDQAMFFASGSSNKWEGRLSAADLAAYRARIGTLISPDELAWLEWGERRSA